MTIDWAHPAEAATALAVGAGILTGGYALFRLMFGGTNTRREPLIPLPEKQYTRILVPTGIGMCHDDYVNEAASLACNLAGKKGNSVTEIIFTYVIPVPRALPLNAEMPLEEAAADEILNAAARLARDRGMTRVTKQLRKGRSVVDETLKAVDQENADLVILTPQTHALSHRGVPMAFSKEATMIPASQAAAHAIHAGVGVTPIKREPVTMSRCYAELDTVETSDESETVTGKLLRRLPCEAMVARRSSLSATTVTTPLAFSNN